MPLKWALSVVFRHQLPISRACYESAFERKFEIVGEALGLLRKHAPETFGQIRHAKGAIDFRNVIIHGYAVIDHEAMWDIAIRLLPDLLADAMSQRTRLG